jgi:hypothetical protein
MAKTLATLGLAALLIGCASGPKPATIPEPEPQAEHKPRTMHGPYEILEEWERISLSQRADDKELGDIMGDTGLGMLDDNLPSEPVQAVIASHVYSTLENMEAVLKITPEVTCLDSKRMYKWVSGRATWYIRLNESTEDSLQKQRHSDLLRYRARAYEGLNNCNRKK